MKDVILFQGPITVDIRTLVNKLFDSMVGYVLGVFRPKRNKTVSPGDNSGYMSRSFFL